MLQRLEIRVVRSRHVGQIFVATPMSWQTFQEQVRAIPEGYVEFYMHDDSLDIFIPEAQTALLRHHGLEFRVIKVLDGDNVTVFYDHIPSAIADLSFREEAIKSAILARDGIAAFCLGYNCENEVEDDLGMNGFRYLPFVHLAPQGVRTYLFKVIYTRDEAAEVMGAHFASNCSMSGYGDCRSVISRTSLGSTRTSTALTSERRAMGTSQTVRRKLQIRWPARGRKKFCALRSMAIIRWMWKS